MSTGIARNRGTIDLRREAYIQLALGIAALAASGLVTRWLLLGRLATVVWIGVLGAIAVAIVFGEEGWRAFRTLRSLEESAGISRLASRGADEYIIRPPGTVQRHRRQLILLLFGFVASVGPAGLNVLVPILVVRPVAEFDLLAWTLLVLPVCLAVWLLPPRGLRFESNPKRHDTRARDDTCPRGGLPPLDALGSVLHGEGTSTRPGASGLDRQPVSRTPDSGRVFFLRAPDDPHEER